MALSGGAIAGIVVASGLVLFILLWIFISWYTWRRAKRFDLGQPRVAIDPKEYQGKWYEIARYPQWFERDCSNATATYTYQPEESRIQVLNRCQKKDGSWKEAHGWAYPTERDGILAVSFFPGIYGNYTVIKRDHNLSIVSNPEKNSLWVLSRTPQINDQKRKSIFQWLHKNGYDLDKLEFPHHQS